MKPDVAKQLRAVGLAACAGALALTTALGAAQKLRQAAMRTSRQQPAPEALFEPPTPTSPARVAKGRALFLDSCAHCHGADARGDEGPDLHGLQVSDRYIHKIITRGIAGEMPSFAKKHGEADVRALTAYVRSLE